MGETWCRKAVKLICSFCPDINDTQGSDLHNTEILHTSSFKVWSVGCILTWFLNGVCFVYSEATKKKKRPLTDFYCENPSGPELASLSACDVTGQKQQQLVRNCQHGLNLPTSLSLSLLFFFLPSATSKKNVRKGRHLPRCSHGVKRLICRLSGEFKSPCCFSVLTFFCV